MVGAQRRERRQPPVAELGQHKRLVAGAAGVPVVGIGPQWAKVELLDGPLEILGLVGDVRVYVKIVEVAAHVDIWSPRSQAC